MEKTKAIWKQCGKQEARRKEEESGVKKKGRKQGGAHSKLRLDNQVRLMHCRK